MHRHPPCQRLRRRSHRHPLSARTAATCSISHRQRWCSMSIPASRPVVRPGRRLRITIRQHQRKVLFQDAEYRSENATSSPPGTAASSSHTHRPPPHPGLAREDLPSLSPGHRCIALPRQTDQYPKSHCPSPQTRGRLRRLPRRASTAPSNLCRTRCRAPPHPAPAAAESSPPAAHAPPPCRREPPYTSSHPAAPPLSSPRDSVATPAAPQPSPNPGHCYSRHKQPHKLQR